MSAFVARSSERNLAARASRFSQCSACSAAAARALRAAVHGDDPLGRHAREGVVDLLALRRLALRRPPSASAAGGARV